MYFNMKTGIWRILLFPFWLVLFACTQQPEPEGILKQYFNERQSQLDVYFSSDSVQEELADYAQYLLDHSIFHASFGVTEQQFTKAVKYKFHSSHQLYLMRDQLRTELTTVSPTSNLLMDRDVISAAFLEEHVLLSHKIKNKPWNSYLSDEEFRQYVLPYRAHREPLDPSWRRHFQRELLPMLDTFRQNNDPVAVCSLVNTHLGQQYELRRIKEKLRGELSFQQINQLEGGMCEELVNITTYAMRSVGIPVVRDFTPVWGKQAHFGHHWLALVLPNDTTLAFDGTYRHPERGKNAPSRTAAKVYRFNFEVDVPKLEAIMANRSNLPELEFIKSPYITDVTPLYYETVDLNLPIPSNAVPARHYSLGVFNNGQWQPVAYGEINNDKASLTFNNLNRNILYVLLGSQGNNWLPRGDPFLLDSNGRTNYLIPRALQQICLKTWFDWEEKAIRPDDTLKLEYWEKNNWVIIQDTLRLVEGQICVDDVPAGALLRLTNYRGRPHYMRPFVFRDENRPIFY